MAISVKKFYKMPGWCMVIDISPAWIQRNNCLDRL